MDDVLRKRDRDEASEVSSFEQVRRKVREGGEVSDGDLLAIFQSVSREELVALFQQAYCLPDASLSRMLQSFPAEYQQFLELCSLFGIGTGQDTPSPGIETVWQAVRTFFTAESNRVELLREIRTPQLLLFPEWNGYMTGLRRLSAVLRRDRPFGHEEPSIHQMMEYRWGVRGRSHEEALRWRLFMVEGSPELKHVPRSSFYRLEDGYEAFLGDAQEKGMTCCDPLQYLWLFLSNAQKGVSLDQEGSTLLADRYFQKGDDEYLAHASFRGKYLSILRQRVRYPFPSAKMRLMLEIPL